MKVIWIVLVNQTIAVLWYEYQSCYLFCDLSRN